MLVESQSSMPRLFAQSRSLDMFTGEVSVKVDMAMVGVEERDDPSRDRTRTFDGRLGATLTADAEEGV